MNERFEELVSQVPKIAMQHHLLTIFQNSERNRSSVGKTIRDIREEVDRCLVVCAGPSLYRRESLRRVKSSYSGVIVSTDGAYIQCLKHGIVPDYVITLDPHPTRMIRWFGDKDFKKNSAHDDYFKRQDLDIGFREQTQLENLKNIELVDQNKTKLIICSTAPENVVERTKDFERYWFAPLIDNPDKPDSISRQLVRITGLPAMNTGATVGNAAWIFAYQVLKAKDIAVIGMDLGYYADLPLEKTQSWNMLKGKENYEDFYPRLQGHWGDAYTDPTYHFYKQALLDLLAANGATITNCTEGGLLVGDGVICKDLDKWLLREEEAVSG